MGKHFFILMVIAALVLSICKANGNIEWSWWVVLLPAYFFPTFVVLYAIVRSIAFRVCGKKNLKKTTKNTEI